jgi:plastocyanin
VTILVAITVMAVAPSPVAATGTPVPPSGVTYTLWGHADFGWGNASGSETNPGPTLFAYPGQNVTLKLYSEDFGHNWFLDANNNGRDDPGEITSPDFSSATTPLVFNFTAPRETTGPFTYRCKYHPTSMTGKLVVLTPPNLTLWGDAARGWGLNATHIWSPGPTLYVLAGSNLTLHLYAKDGPAAHHDFFVDANDDGAIDNGEANTSAFNSPTTPLVANYTIPASLVAGIYVYRCHYQPSLMYGSIWVYNATAVRPVGATPGTFTLAVVVVIVAILGVATAYAVHTARSARRGKSP